MAILIAPSRDGVILAAPSDGLLESVRAERDENARTIQQLATRVGELETALAAARELAVTAPAEPAPAAVTPSVVEAVAAANVEATGALLAAAGPPEPTLVVVIDDAADWDGLARDDQRVLVTAPADLDAAALGADPPARLVVNLAAPGGLARLAALRRDGVTAPAFGVLRDVENTRVVGLGLVEVVDPQASPEALVAAVEATAPRGARVFAAGRDADALMKMRQVLAKQGLSVSMARDTKQIEELVAMVRPQVMVVDLGLPGAEGYELVFRAAAMAPAPGVVVILSDADPLPTLSKKLRERLAAGVGTSVRDFFALASAQKLDVKRAKARPAAAHAAL
jgi:CheY-like chemotaxis protein